MNKKFITCALAAMMMASLAVPAAAADTNSDYGNTTDVVLNYKNSDIDVPAGPEGEFTITIPSQINLKAEANGDQGVTISGTTRNAIKFTGTIGQNDYVRLRVQSANDYHLVDAATNEKVAGYTVMYDTIKNNGVELNGPNMYDEEELADHLYIYGDNANAYLSDNYAKAFQGEATISMVFRDDGQGNDIFGKGEYNDTLTFDYKYATYGKDLGDDWYTTNVNNGLEASDDNDNTDKIITINCNGGSTITIKNNKIDSINLTDSNHELIYVDKVKNAGGSPVILGGYISIPGADAAIANISVTCDSTTGKVESVVINASASYDEWESGTYQIKLDGNYVIDTFNYESGHPV